MVSVVEHPGKRAVIYARISMDRVGDGEPLDRQIESCEGLARAHGLQVVGTIKETQSAYDKKIRPEWSKVIEMIRGGEVDFVLAHKLDRIHRRPREMLDLIDLVKQTGVSVLSLDGELSQHNEAGRLLAGLMAFVAELEIERKSARQKDKNRQDAAKGKFWHGGFRAFGFNPDGTHVPEEAEAIRGAVDDVLAGVPLKEIARRWQAAGMTSGRNTGKEWRIQSVRAVLLNPKNAGIRTYNGTRMREGLWEPIIPEARHIQLRAFLTDPARKVGGNPGGKTAQNLLSGIALCGACEQPVRSGSSRGEKTYTCSRGCVATDRALADEFVRESVSLVMKGVGVPGRVTTERPKKGLSPELIFDERERLEQSRATLVRALSVGAISGSEFDDGVADIARQLEALDASTPLVAPTFMSLTAGADEFVTVLREGSIRAQREGLKMAIGDTGSIILKPKGRGRRNVPIEAQVEVWFSLGGELIAGHQFDR